MKQTSKGGSWGHSLAIQWLEPCTFTAEGTGSVPGQGTILQATQSQKINKQIKTKTKEAVEVWGWILNAKKCWIGSPHFGVEDQFLEQMNTKVYNVRSKHSSSGVYLGFSL